MRITARARRSLEEICQTFCPDGDGLPNARDAGVVEAVLAAVAGAREAEQRQLTALLSVWDTPPMSALAGVGPRRFSELSREQREQVLRSWADSRRPERRALFQVLRKAALLFYYLLPGAETGSRSVWEHIGYDGPLGPLLEAPAKALSPLSITADTELQCDVAIVGSGAGGGPAAAILAGAGLDVIVVESGDYYDDQDFDGNEYRALTRYYMGAPSATHDQSVGLIAGACLGGGTVVNYSTSFRTPDEVREEWAGFGVPAFTSSRYTASLDAVTERMGVNQEHNQPSTREQKLQQGCVKLGWHVDAMPRGVRNCAQGRECGYCGLGCRVGAKQSVVKTWLSDAQAAGARIVVGARVGHVIVRGGRAAGLEARTSAGHRLTVRARAVIASCGAIHTPALLRRSGLHNPNIGRHLHLHPAAAVFGVFDEELKPWEGVMQALYSDQFRDLDGGYGLKYETAPSHPHLLVPFSPWRSARQHLELMEGLSNTTPVGVLLRDRDGGEVRVGRDGEPVVRYRLSRFDTRHLRVGLQGAAQILEAAGARQIFSSHAKWVCYEPGRSGSAQQFMAAADAAGYGAGQITLNSFHIMGSARMGGSPATSACDPAAQTWEVRDLYVMDGSSFPTASGVNPQVSIQAIAHMCAQGLAARLT